MLVSNISLLKFYGDNYYIFHHDTTDSFASIFEEQECEICVRIRGLEAFNIVDFFTTFEEKYALSENSGEATKFVYEGNIIEREKQGIV